MVLNERYYYKFKVGDTQVAKEYSKEEAILKKKQAIKKINQMFEVLICDGKNQNLKKVYLISKWLHSYAGYILFEPKFVPQRNMAYKRGNIIQVNFGFRLGSELGGVHYAVVIDKENNRSSDSITVVPMSSLKENKKVHKRDCNIGNEFYHMMQARVNGLIAQIDREYGEVHERVNTLKELLDAMQIQQDDLEQVNDAGDKLKLLLKSAIEKNQELSEHRELLIKTREELGYMKEGSIVKVGQIVTVSKIRIIKPKKTGDVLAGMSLSENTMKKINQKFREIYVFEE